MSTSSKENLPAVWYADVPRSITRQVIFGLTLLVVAFGGFGTWAFRAPLAAAIIAQGSFVATGRNKIVQHLEGGIIKDILIKEGDTIQRGDVIMSLDETAAEANERELFLRQIRLEATAARLLAQYNELEKLVFPPNVENSRGLPDIDVILDSQELAFRVTRTAWQNDRALLARNIEALRARTVGYDTQLASHRRQIDLLMEERDDKAKLLEDGLIRRSEFNVLQRAVIEAEGQIGRLEAEIAETTHVRLKYETQIRKADSEYRQAALDDLQGIQAELESIREKARKAKSVLVRSDITAPTTGTVVRMHYHTSGGVIEPGKPIAEILPSDAPLIVEALISRTDIDDVKLGQGAVVRLSALNQRTTPVLNGEVIYISADAVADNSDGSLREVYVTRINLPPHELARVVGFAPTPGMPAEIMIQTSERTFVQYLTKPISDSMSRAFREQ